MTVVRGTSRQGIERGPLEISIPARAVAPTATPTPTPTTPTTPTTARACRAEARWLVSRCAIGAARPDFGFAPTGRDLQLNWLVRFEQRGGQWLLSQAGATLCDAPGEPVRTIFACDHADRSVRLWIHADPQHHITGLELLGERSALLSLSVGTLPGEPDRRALPDARPLLAYARTPLIGAPAPLGLGVRGGRYEFDAASIA